MISEGKREIIRVLEKAKCSWDINIINLKLIILKKTWTFFMFVSIYFNLVWQKKRKTAGKEKKKGKKENKSLPFP